MRQRAQAYLALAAQTGLLTATAVQQVETTQTSQKYDVVTCSAHPLPFSSYVFPTPTVTGSSGAMVVTGTYSSATVAIDVAVGEIGGQWEITAFSCPGITTTTTTTLPPTTTTTTTAPSADPGSQAAATAAAQAWAAQAINNCAAQNGQSASITPSQIGVNWTGIAGPGFVTDQGGEGNLMLPSQGFAQFDATFENGAWSFMLLNANFC